MSKAIDARDSLAGFLRDLDTRLTRQERRSFVGGGSGGGTGPQGPPGPPGPTAVSADSPNAAKLGSDSLLFVRQLAYVVAKQTPPTAADYGQASIPLNAVWVVVP